MVCLLKNELFRVTSKIHNEYEYISAQLGPWPTLATIIIDGDTIYVDSVRNKAGLLMVWYGFILVIAIS